MQKSDYFYRAVVFAKREEKVSLVDLHNPEEETPPLEPWLGLVVSLADGQHSIQQLIEYLTGHYKGSPPDQMEETLDSVIKRLVDADVIKLSEEPVELPYYLSLQADKLDLDLAKQLMADDNYGQEQS